MPRFNILIPLLLTFLAGFSTLLGSIVSLSAKKFKESHMRFALGVSAGVMVYISFAELLRTSIGYIGLLHANMAFFCGIGLIMVIDFFVPHKYIVEESVEYDIPRGKLLTAGVFTTLGVAIHNIPEGLAVFMSSLGGIKLGVALAFAIGIHNIPEGIAIAMPIYYATKDKKKALWYSFLAAIAEPIGAIVGLVILMPFMNQTFLALSFAFAAGVMVFISFDELLPLTYTHKEDHLSILGIIIGMLVMAAGLCCL